MSCQLVRLGDVVEIEREGVDPRALPAGTRYLGLEHLTGDGSIVEGETEANELASTKFRFGPRHVLFGKLRPYLRKVVRPNFAGICSTDIIPISPGARLDRDYLFNFLRTDEVIRRATSMSSGANLPRLSPKHLVEFKIPLPPLDEQRRIAAILDQADDLRRKRREAIERLVELPHQLFLQFFGDPASNPFNFPFARLSELIDFQGGTQPPKSHFLYEDGPDRVRFVQTRDFKTDAYKTYLPTNLARRPFTIDDVMIGRYGPPVFQIFRGLAGTYNVALMKAAPKKGILRDFIFYLLQEKKLHGHVVNNSIRTAGQSGVNLDLLENYPSYLPPLELQDRFSKVVRRSDALVDRQKVQLQELDALFASLQHRAFNGEL